MKYLLHIVCAVCLITGCKSGKDVAFTGAEKHSTQSTGPELTFYFIQAASEHARGNTDKALVLYKKCLDIDDKSAAVHFEISKIYAEMSDLTRSMDHATTAVELDGSNVWYKLHMADLLQYTTQFEEAANICGQVVQMDDRPEYLIAYSEALIYAGKYEEAIGVYDRIEEKVGSSPDLLNQKYRLYMEMGKEKEAIKMLEDAIAEDPKDLSLYGLLAGAYESMGDLDKSMEIFHKMAEIDPENGRVHLALFSYYRFKNEHEEAFKEARLAFAISDLEIDEKMKVLLDIYDETETSDAHLQHAYDLLDTLVKVHPNEAKAHSIYGDFLLRDDRMDAARTHFEKALELDSDKYIIWNQVMFLDLQSDDYESLFQHSSEAMELFPNQPGVYYFNGLSLYRKKQYDQAIETLESGKLLVIDNEQLLREFYQTLGDAYYHSGDHERGYQNYDLALSILPDNPYILNNYAYYLSLEGNDLDRASEMAAKANILVPNQPSYLDTYGWIKFQQQDFQGAETLIKQALDNGGGDNAVILEHYGDVLFQLNQAEDAVSYWKKAVEAGSESTTIEQKIKERQYVE